MATSESQRGIQAPVRRADPPGYAANPQASGDLFGLAYFPAAGEFLPAVSLAATPAASYNADSLAEMRRLVHQADVSERRNMAVVFAARIRELSPQLEVLAEFEPELFLTVVLPARDLDQELAATTLFLDLARSLSDPEKADLTFHLSDEPSEPRGERLH